jgi:parvulin-like peptidyl-prolyl isomerase
MKTNPKISNRDLIFEAKISGKISELTQGIIRRQAIEQHAKEAGIDLTIAELQTAADRFRTREGLESAEATKQWLAANFFSIDDFEYIISQNLITEKLAQHLFGKEVEKFFYQNSIEYSSAIIYEVILEDQNLAMELFYSIQEGDLSFADVAHQYIPDLELRRRGGYIGEVGRRQFRPEISAAVFAANPPQLIKPIITAIGVHLIYVEEIVHAQLDDRLYQQILTDLFDRWLTETVAKISVEISIDTDSSSGA